MAEKNVIFALNRTRGVQFVVSQTLCQNVENQLKPSYFESVKIIIIVAKFIISAKMIGKHITMAI